MTHDIRLYVNPNLDQIQEWFETANGQRIQAKGSGTIALETLIDGKNSYVHLRNVHYCPELDSNLLSLGVLEKKGFKFVGKQGLLSVIDNQGDTVLQAKRKGTIYPLLQPNIQQTKPLTNPIFKVTKPVIQRKWHPCKGYSDCEKLVGLPKVTRELEPVGVDTTELFPPIGESTQPTAKGSEHHYRKTEKPNQLGSVTYKKSPNLSYSPPGKEKLSDFIVWRTETGKRSIDGASEATLQPVGDR